VPTGFRAGFRAGPSSSRSWQLLPDDDALSVPLKSCRIYVSGFVEGTDVIFVHSSGEVYMVQLKSRQVTKMAMKSGRLYPFTDFDISGMTMFPHLFITNAHAINYRFLLPPSCNIRC
jgi:hypothetical protein